MTRSAREASPPSDRDVSSLTYPKTMNRREIALAYIRREVEETGELTLFALRQAQEHRIGHAAMMAAAREGLRRRKLAAERLAAPSRARAVDASTPPTGPQTPTPMTSPHTRIVEAQAAITELEADLRRHEKMLADAKRARAQADEVREIEVLVANDHALIASWNRVIAEQEQNASDPVLIELRRRVEVLTFEECVVALISRDNAGPLSVPIKTPESLDRLRDSVFDKARRGELTLPAQPAPRKTRQARLLPIVTISGKRYYRDDRLREHRAVDDPHDRLPL